MLKRIAIILLGLVFFPDLKAQQITSISVYREANPWLQGNNPAGLIFNPSLTFTIAEGSYRYTSGKFRMSTAAASIHHFRICSESFRQLKKLQLYGRIHYSNDNQQQRQWSATLQPESHLLNFGDTIAGRQQCETYSICGKIAIPLNPNWTIGGNLDYAARFNSKNKDPRNKNDQTNLLFTPGIIYSAGHFHTGANLIYQRIVEKITYTTLDQQIRDGRTFYPLWFFITEDLQNGTSNLRTYREERYGAAFQFSVNTKYFTWFNEFLYTGGPEKTDIYPIQNTKAGIMERRVFCYTGNIQLKCKLHHTLKPTYFYQGRTAYDYIQGKLTSKDNIAIEDFGRVKRSVLSFHQASLTYILSHPMDSIQNRWSFSARIDYQKEQTTFLLYPARFTQTINKILFTAGYEHKISIQKNMLEIALQTSYSHGQGHLPQLSNESTSPLPEIKFSRKQDLLFHDFRIATAETMTYDFILRYTCPLNSKYSLTSTIHLNYLQEISGPHTSRIQSEISTGLIF